MQSNPYKISIRLHTVLKLLEYNFYPETPSHYAKIYTSSGILAFYDTHREGWLVVQKDQKLVQILRSCSEPIYEKLSVLEEDL